MENLKNTTYKNITYKCKGEILTPVHVGSGRILQENIDFFIDKKNNKLGKGDPHKILQIIGPEKIQWWTNAIMINHDIWKELQKERKKKLEDVSNEILPLNTIETKTQLREHIRNQYTGNPILPGSSIKGAIRTALITEFIISKVIIDKSTKKKHLDLKKLDESIRKGINNNQIEKVNETVLELAIAKEIETKAIAQKDVFKFLKVSDAEIPIQNLHVDLIQTLNLMGEAKEWQIKSKLSSLLECVTGKFECKITFDERFFKFNPLDIKSLESLLEKTNKHTKRLVYGFEYKTFGDKNNSNKISDGEIAEKLPNNIIYIYNNINSQIENLKNTCVLRLGFASGWNYMTGGWLKTNNDWKQIMKQLVKAEVYIDFPFPKTRRLLSDYSLPGFVKLTFEPVEES